MKKVINLILLSFFFCSFIDSGEIKAHVVQDSTEFTPREFNIQKIEEYKDGGDYDYLPPAKSGTNLLEVILAYLAQLFQNLFYYSTETPSGKVIFILVLVAVAVYAIIKILKIRSNQLISSKELGGGLKDIHHENIHELDLSELLNKALKSENYREAIRLTYLEALKVLSDKNIISWTPGKTNSEYVYEINSNEIKAGFKDLNYYFIYTWYGNFQVDQSHYKTVDTIFTNWKSIINT